jgi:Tfp pilus assembly protein PilN
MINLLPPDIKKARRYGRLNRLIIKLLLGLILIGVISSAVMLSGLEITSDDEKFLDESIAVKEQIYSNVQIYEAQASELRANVTTIEKLFDREVKFSNLLVEIASSIPVGAELTGLSLTGTNTAPLQISATTNTQELAGTLRRNLVDSGVFETADIQSVNQTGGGETGDPIRYAVSIQASLTGSAQKIEQEKAARAAAAAAASQPVDSGAQGTEGGQN